MSTYDRMPNEADALAHGSPSLLALLFRLGGAAAARLPHPHL